MHGNCPALGGPALATPEGFEKAQPAGLSPAAAAEVPASRGGTATLPARSRHTRTLSCPFGFHRDNVEWSEEQAAAAERKVQENSSQRVCPEKQGALVSFLVCILSWQCGARLLERTKELQPPGSFDIGIEWDQEGTS